MVNEQSLLGDIGELLRNACHCECVVKLKCYIEPCLAIKQYKIEAERYMHMAR